MDRFSVCRFTCRVHEPRFGDCRRRGGGRSGARPRRGARDLGGHVSPGAAAPRSARASASPPRIGIALLLLSWRAPVACVGACERRSPLGGQRRAEVSILRAIAGRTCRMRDPSAGERSGSSSSAFAEGLAVVGRSHVDSGCSVSPAPPRGARNAIEVARVMAGRPGGDAVGVNNSAAIEHVRLSVGNWGSRDPDPVRRGFPRDAVGFVGFGIAAVRPRGGRTRVRFPRASLGALRELRFRGFATRSTVRDAQQGSRRTARCVARSTVRDAQHGSRRAARFATRSTSS